MSSNDKKDKNNKNSNEEKKDKEILKILGEEDESEDAQIVIVPFKNAFLKIFKGNYYYILDRYKYDINTVMMLLDLNKINKLAEFYKDKENEDGIERVKFVEKMRKELPCDLNNPMDETNLVYGLYKFFCEIDFNGDGHMQWEEFTQFVIDTVEGDNDAKVDENEDDTKTKIFNEKKMIKYKRYHISQRLRDNLIHKRDVVSGVFLPRIETMILNEYGTKIIKIYNPKTGRCEKSIDLEYHLNPRLYSETENKYSRKKIDTKQKQNKITEKINKNTSYSVLCMTCFQNIVAMCLSDKRIVFFHFASDDRIELVHEIQTPVLEKRIWYLPEHNIWLSSGSKLDKYNYYTVNELDVEFEYYNQKYECHYNDDHPYRKSYCDVSPHKGEILDCIEILKPMMVVTACMDGKIRLINLSDRDIVKVWSHHALGVRCLDYNPLIESVGYILSVGFEYFINVYCTDLSLDEAFKGKLEGHYAPVISCKFLSNSYMAVSVDEEGNVRIWDTKIKLCLQLIPTPKKNIKVSNILSLPKYNKFVVYGNKIIYYDAKYKEEETVQKNQVKDDNYPINVSYNNYYQQFFVTTYRDVRVYSKEGKIFKIYKKLSSNEHFDPDTKIKYFLFENNHRKFYIGFSNGAIMQFNAGNGSLIKPINETEVEKDGIQTYIYSHSKEITSLYYYYDEEDENSNLILLSTAYDSLINVYNEANTEETEKLRTIRGGHTVNGKVNEINCMDFSKQLNLFATGSSDGLVNIWDFEVSKINDIFYIPSHRGEKLSVHYLKFLDPYPILLASYNDGSLYFWDINQKSAQSNGNLFMRARNYYKHISKIDVAPVKYINTYLGEIKEMVYNVPLRKYFDENSPFMNPNKVYETVKKDKRKKTEGSFKEEENKIINEEIEQNLDIVPSQYKNEIIDHYTENDDYDDQEQGNKGAQQIKKNRYFVFLGDVQGNIKIIDIMDYINKRDIESCSKNVIKSTFNVLKKEDINLEAIVNHNLSHIKEPVFPKFTNLYISLIRNEFKAHSDEITCITIITEPLSFVTSGKDKLVKIWDFDCKCLGVINALPKLSKIDGPLPPWTFKVNEEKILEKEIKEVVAIFEKVGVEKIEVGSKLDKEMENIEIVEKKEEVKEVKKEVTIVNKKRYKPLDKKDKFAKKRKEDDNKVNISYEGFYVQDAQKKIENMINEDVPHLGINEIAMKVINTVVESEDSKKNFEKQEKSNEKEKENLQEKEKTNLVQFRLPTQKNINQIINKNPQKLINPPLTTKAQTMKTLIPINTNKILNDQETLLQKKLTKKMSINTSNNNLTSDSKDIQGEFLPIVSEYHPNQAPATRIELKKRTDISNKAKQYIYSQNNAICNLACSKRKTKEFTSKFRDNLFSERLFGRTFSTPKSGFTKSCMTTKNSNEIENDKVALEKRKFDKKLNELKFPAINDKIIFNKGEVEKLLNYQFYTSSYKACCQISSQNDIPNSSMQKNFKNNWRLVEQFASDQKENEFENDKKYKQKNNFMNHTAITTKYKTDTTESSNFKKLCNKTGISNNE